MPRNVANNNMLVTQKRLCIKLELNTMERRSSLPSDKKDIQISHSQWRQSFHCNYTQISPFEQSDAHALTHSTLIYNVR